MKKYLGLIIILIISSCSKIEFVLNWADTYIANQLDHYFDIDGSQKDLIKSSVQDHLVTIKKIIFPRLASELQSILKEIDERLLFSSEMVAIHEQNLKILFYDTLKLFETSAVEFSTHLGPQQLNHFRREFEKKTNELEEEGRDPIKASGKRFDKIIKYFEEWMHKLSVEQRNDLKKFCDIKYPYNEQIMNRQSLENEFLINFVQMEKRKKFVSRLFNNYDSLRDSKYSKAISINQKNLFEVIANIMNKLSEKQRHFLSESLKDKIEQLVKMSGVTRHF